MSFTQTQIDDMPFCERVARACLKLGWVASGSSTEWADIPSEIIRRILWPFLEPVINTRPRTVICSTLDGPEERTSGELVTEALTNAGLQEIPNEDQHDSLGRALGVWSGL